MNVVNVVEKEEPRTNNLISSLLFTSSDESNDNDNEDEKENDYVTIASKLREMIIKRKIQTSQNASRISDNIISKLPTSSTNSKPLKLLVTLKPPTIKSSILRPRITESPRNRSRLEYLRASGLFADPFGEDKESSESWQPVVSKELILSRNSVTERKLNPIQSLG